MKIGVISGYNIYNFLENSERIFIETPYGDVNVEKVDFSHHEIFFLNRHGIKSNVPPHKIKYKANISALKLCGVNCIFSIGTVGSINRKIKPGDFIIINDFIDFTKSGAITYFDDKRIHVDMTTPFCQSLREIFIKSCNENGDISYHENGVYLNTEGPRLETISEIKLFSNIADVVGMTIVPESILSREKGICYASLCVVCNMAAGLQDNLDTGEISSIFKKKENKVIKILKSSIHLIEKRNKCKCKKDLSMATI